MAEKAHKTAGWAGRRFFWLSASKGLGTPYLPRGRVCVETLWVRKPVNKEAPWKYLLMAG